MINLLPNAIREEHVYGRRNKKLVALIALIAGTAIAVAIIILFSLSYLEAEKQSTQEAIDDNKAVISQLESETSDLSTVASKLGTTYKLFDESIKFSEIIPQIGSVLPQGTVIDGLSLTGGSLDPLQLNVSMTTAELAPVLQKNLVDSELFEAADIVSISPSGSEGTSYQYSASVSVSFTGSAEAKRKAKAAEAARIEAQKAAEEAEEE